MNYAVYDVTKTQAEPVNLDSLDDSYSTNLNASTTSTTAIDYNVLADPKNKKKSVFAFIVGFFIFGSFFGYALSRYYAETSGQEFELGRREWFAFKNHVFSSEKIDVRPGDIVTTNTALKSESSAPMWTFIRILTSVYDGGPLFEPVDSSGQLGISNKWTEVSQGVIGDLYEYVYRLIEPLQSGATSPPLMQGLKMVDMGIEEFSRIGIPKINMKGYATGTEDGTNPDDAWNSIRIKYPEDF